MMANEADYGVYRVLVKDGDRTYHELVTADDFTVAAMIFGGPTLTLHQGGCNVAYYPSGRWVEVVRMASGEGAADGE